MQANTNTFTKYRQETAENPVASRPRTRAVMRVAKAPVGVEAAPFPLVITPEVRECLLETVGARPPESGGKAFSPVDVMGIDTFEFDAGGSAAAGGAVYRPDSAWGSRRVKHHLDAAEPRAWSGDVHSHPGAQGRPSPEVGVGLGDLGYVRQVFAQNEWMEFFLLPILTGTGTGDVVVHPWVCQRGPRPKLMHAALQVAKAEAFPERRCNPEWEARVAAEKASTPTQPGDVADMPRPVAPLQAVNLTRLRIMLRYRRNDVVVFGTRWESHREIEVHMTHTRLRVHLPETLPYEAPRALDVRSARVPYVGPGPGWHCGPLPPPVEGRLAGWLCALARRAEEHASFTY